MTDIWEVWKDICHSNHVMKIKVKVLGPEPKKNLCMRMRLLMCKCESYWEGLNREVWRKEGTQTQVLISRQSKALDVISWELPFKGTALVHSSAHKGGETFKFWQPRESKFLTTSPPRNIENTLMFTVSNSLLWLVVVSHGTKKVRNQNSKYQYWKLYICISNG